MREVIAILIEVQCLGGVAGVVDERSAARLDVGAQRPLVALERQRLIGRATTKGTPLDANEDQAQPSLPCVAQQQR